jgi:two-component system response regulator FlrC
MSQPILLCVDDRPALLELRKTALEGSGYSVMTATDALSAIAILEKARVAAGVLECKVEGIDAEAIAWLIKKRFPNEPIVLMSAYSDVPERVLWLVDEYVMRSEPADSLLRVIARVIGLSVAKRAAAAA